MEDKKVDAEVCRRREMALVPPSLSPRLDGKRGERMHESRVWSGQEGVVLHQEMTGVEGRVSRNLRVGAEGICLPPWLDIVSSYQLACVLHYGKRADERKKEEGEKDGRAHEHQGRSIRPPFFSHHYEEMEENEKKNGKRKTKKEIQNALIRSELKVLEEAYSRHTSFFLPSPEQSDCKGAGKRRRRRETARTSADAGRSVICQRRGGEVEAVEDVEKEKEECLAAGENRSKPTESPSGSSQICREDGEGRELQWPVSLPGRRGGLKSPGHMQPERTLRALRTKAVRLAFTVVASQAEDFKEALQKKRRKEDEEEEREREATKQDAMNESRGKEDGAEKKRSQSKESSEELVSMARAREKESLKDLGNSMHSLCSSPSVSSKGSSLPSSSFSRSSVSSSVVSSKVGSSHGALTSPLCSPHGRRSGEVSSLALVGEEEEEEARQGKTREETSVVVLRQGTPDTQACSGQRESEDSSSSSRESPSSCLPSSSSPSLLLSTRLFSELLPDDLPPVNAALIVSIVWLAMLRCRLPVIPQDILRFLVTVSLEIFRPNRHPLLNSSPGSSTGANHRSFAFPS